MSQQPKSQTTPLHINGLKVRKTPHDGIEVIVKTSDGREIILMSMSLSLIPDKGIEIEAVDKKFYKDSNYLWVRRNSKWKIAGFIDLLKYKLGVTP